MRASDLNSAWFEWIRAYPDHLEQGAHGTPIPAIPVTVRGGHVDGVWLVVERIWAKELHYGGGDAARLPYQVVGAPAGEGIRYDPYRFSLLIDLDAVAARNCAMHDDFAGVIVAGVLEADKHINRPLRIGRRRRILIKKLKVWLETSGR